MEKKIVYVADAGLREADLYRLAEDITYDVMGRTIWRGGESVRLAPQAATLFLQFLHAKEHSITSDDINRRLWNGKGSKNGIHAAVKRLPNDWRNTACLLKSSIRENVIC